MQNEQQNAAPGMCRERVYDRSSRWPRPHPCSLKAVTEAGYCKIHDPQLREQRDKLRPPAKWKRRNMACEIIRNAIVRRLGDEWDRAVDLIRYEHVDVPWPLPQWLLDLKEGEPKT